MATTTANNDLVELAKVDVLTRLSNLEQLLTTQDPMIPVHLKEIHKALIQYEELVHMMDDHAIGILMQSRAKHAKIELVAEAMKSKNKKALNKTTVDDI